MNYILKLFCSSELANAREKLARLQSVVARIEAHGAAVPAELSLELARLVATEVAEVGEGEAELEFLPEVDYEEDEDIDASEDGLAAMSMRARYRRFDSAERRERWSFNALLNWSFRTEYQMKLAEQQDAVERLREERHRLLAIQSELQKLHNSCSVNENPEAEQNYNVSQRLASSQERINPGASFCFHFKIAILNSLSYIEVLNSNEEVWQELRHRAIERESHSQSRPAATRRIIAEPLNNTRDNLSEASTNQRR